MLTVFVTAVMIWELALMIQPKAPTPGMLLAALTASVLSGVFGGDKSLILILTLFLIPPILGAIAVPRERVTFFGFSLAILIAGWGLVIFRETYGMVWLLWLMLVVVATDVFGYFAGRILGGPKFWPAVSPKKTWAGTSAGWISAAFVGAVFLTFTEAGPSLIWISALLSFASQMGDIAESAFKRRMGAKDSSTLIPGHGGLFDRFDGVLGAALFMLLISLFVDVPQVAL
jgi:phosphatidate cytidylyltransferase